MNTTHPVTAHGIANPCYDERSSCHTPHLVGGASLDTSTSGGHPKPAAELHDRAHHRRARPADPLHLVRGISSGTLAGLIGDPRYSAIEAAEHHWKDWLLGLGLTDQFQSWTSAWNAYVDAHPHLGYRRVA